MMRQLGVFAKYWEPGAAKTRLATSIGAERAAGVYRAFLATTLRRTEGLAERRVLAYTPPIRRTEFAAIASSRWTLWEQGCGDLGQRISRYFADAVRHQATQTVLIGSDSPTVPLEYIHDAFRMLETVPVVLGPSSDGGYYLIGIAGDVPPLFEDIPWSSADVWRQTIRRLGQWGCPYAELPAWYDVDDIQHLLRLEAELVETVSSDPLLGELLDAVRRSLEGRTWKTM
jgi:rSAM/selenodomain-associated transferase 1